MEKLIEQSARLTGAGAVDVSSGAPKCDWLRLQRFAEACGDENPLYLDPRYGAGSRWSTMLAPPGFVLAIRTPELRGTAATSHCFAHLSEIHIRWDDHLHLGDRINSSLRVIDHTVETRMNGSDVEHMHNEAIYTRNGKAFAQARGVVEIRPLDAPIITRQIHRYEDEEIARMITELDEESPRRGWRPRYWDEVHPDESLPSRLRGPLTWSDLITWVIAEDRSIKAGNLRHLEALEKDVARATHPATSWPYWPIEEAREDLLASQALAMPAPFARSGLLIALACAMLTDWMGDDGFLQELRIRISQPFLYGDACRFNAKIRERFEDERLGSYGSYIDIEVRNQLDEEVALGEASVLLPRPGRPVEVPAAIQPVADGVSA